MKTNYFAIAALAATTLFASCNRTNDGIDRIEDGKTTSMKVSINFPRAETRATADPNGLDYEAEISYVDVFIYYAGSGAFASHAHLIASDFTQKTSTSTSDVYEYTAATKIPTTTGAKNVYVGINMQPTMVDALKNQPESALSTVAFELLSRDFVGMNTGRFLMFSTEAVRSVFVEDDTNAANKVTVTCQRLAAKVTVETDVNVQQAGIPGVLGNLKWAINNFNKKIFMLQGAPEYRKDPNWASGSYVSTDFLPAVEADYAPVLDRKLIGSPALRDYTPKYPSENTSEGKLKKEITRVTVRATFIPDEITEFANGTDNTGGYRVSSHAITVPLTFYAVTPSVVAGTSYFFKVDVADAFALDNGGSVVAYQNGYCYWDIFLNKNPVNPINKWDVLRNDFYKCNITRIVAPGRNTPDLPDPDVTPDTDTSITADIHILFWNTPILSNYELE